MESRILGLDVYKQKMFVSNTATRMGLFFTILTPIAIIAYSVVLLVLFLNRPVVVTAASESTFFTAPQGILLNCSCIEDASCRLSNTYRTDNELSAFCSNAIDLQSGNFTGSRRLGACYGVTASEHVVVEVPPRCSLFSIIESRRNVEFNFSDPSAALQSVRFQMTEDPGTIARWIFRRLREVHREQIDVPPFYPETNLTVWWGEQQGSFSL